jgi:histidine decarboxylase
VSGEPGDGSHPVLAEFRRELDRARVRRLGFPGMDDIDYGPLAEFTAYELNNIGDPYVDPVFSHHTKRFERQVVSWFADLFRAPPGDRWGYVTSGGTECNQFGLRRARNVYPDGVVYYTTAAHYSIKKIVEDYRMPAVQIRTDPRGEMDYADFARAVAPRRGRPAIVVLNVGTTTTEAVDNLGAVQDILAAAGVPGHYIHVDAALAGVPLALLDQDRPPFDFVDGAHSIGISSHKFFATREPGGVVLATTGRCPMDGRAVAYTGSPDTTVSGSRNGMTALKLWYCVFVLGVDVLRDRARQARALAGYALEQLESVGWEAWQAQPHAYALRHRPRRHVPRLRAARPRRAPPRLSELQGDDPLILTLARGHYCPKEHQQHLELAAFYPKIAWPTPRSPRSRPTSTTRCRSSAPRSAPSGRSSPTRGGSSRRTSTSRSTPTPRTTR